MPHFLPEPHPCRTPYRAIIDYLFAWLTLSLTACVLTQHRPIQVTLRVSRNLLSTFLVSVAWHQDISGMKVGKRRSNRNERKCVLGTQVSLLHFDSFFFRFSLGPKNMHGLYARSFIVPHDPFLSLKTSQGSPWGRNPSLIPRPPHAHYQYPFQSPSSAANRELADSRRPTNASQHSCGRSKMEPTPRRRHCPHLVKSTRSQRNA